MLIVSKSGQLAYMICSVPALRFDRLAGRPLDLPPSQECGPAFLLPVQAVQVPRTESVPNFALKRSGTGFEQRTERSFGQYIGVETGRIVPPRCPESPVCPTRGAVIGSWLLLICGYL
jgi:hypothetical protein